MKETWSYLVRLFDDAPRWHKRLVKSQTPAEFTSVVEELVNHIPFASEV